MASCTSLPVRDDDDLWWPLGGVDHHVGALAKARGRRVAGPVEGGHALPGENEGDRFVLEVHDHPPRFGHLVCVGRADHYEAGDGSQRGEVLDGLVGGAVLAHADRVVGEDVDDRDLHQALTGGWPRGRSRRRRGSLTSRVGSWRARGRS